MLAFSFIASCLSIIQLELRIIILERGNFNSYHVRLF